MINSPAPYVGKAGALKVSEVLLPLVLEGRRSARHGHKVLLPGGGEAGVVTSGSFAPSLGHAVALAFVAKEHANEASFVIQADRAGLNARRGELPFYKDGSARKKL
jgi:aminomethyltransferase